MSMWIRKVLCLSLALLSLASGVGGADVPAAPAFLREVKLDALHGVGVWQGGRITALPVFAEAFARDVTGRSRPKDAGGARVGAVALLLECLLSPDRALEWCVLETPLSAEFGTDAEQRAGLGHSRVLAMDALRGLSDAGNTWQPNADRTRHAAELEARLALLLSAGEVVRALPVAGGASAWDALGDADDPELVALLDRLAVAWRVGDVPTVEDALEALASYLKGVQRGAGSQALRLRLEVISGRLHMVSASVVLYAVTLLVSLLAPLRRRWILSLLVSAATIHGAAIVTRAVVSGRLPVQNQYESMIAAGFLLSVATMGLYRVRHDIGFVSAGAAMAALLVGAAEWLELPGRVLELEAGILSSSAILKYHVLTILAGYALVMLGGGVAGMVLYRTGRGASEQQIRSLHRVQTLLGYTTFWVLGTGIFLGAVWADKAWGRWWAFDAKETWSLVTWSVYLAMVHIPAARVLQRRQPVVVALLHLLGVLAMMWTYFGVNLLLPSLHSYA